MGSYSGADLTCRDLISTRTITAATSLTVGVNISLVASGGVITATSFVGALTGTASQATQVMVSGVARSAVTTATADTIAARNASGDIYAVNFRGSFVGNLTGNATTSSSCTGNAATSTNCHGLSYTSSYLRIGATDYQGNFSATASTVAMRDSSANIYASLFVGTWYPSITNTQHTLSSEGVMYLDKGFYVVSMRQGEGYIIVEQYVISHGVYAWTPFINRTNSAFSVVVYSASSNPTLVGCVRIKADNFGDNAYITVEKIGT